MSKMWRVMRNRLGYGTSVVEDCLPTEALADKVCDIQKRRAKKNKSKTDSFFTQEYEEARHAWGNEGGVQRT